MLTGPDWKSFTATQVLVAVPVVLFFGWVAPDVGKIISWGPVAVAGTLALISVVALLATGLKNPGIVPRNAPRSIPDLCAHLLNGDVHGDASSEPCRGKTVFCMVFAEVSSCMFNSHSN